MTKKRATTLDEIRAQAEPEVIEIPGFRPSTTINVAVRPVDLTPHLLTVGVENPLLEIARKKAQDGMTKEEIEADMSAEIERRAGEGAGRDLVSFLPVVDTICKEALVEPAWDQISEICPLTLNQKMAVFNWAMGDAKELQSFRGQ